MTKIKQITVFLLLLTSSSAFAQDYKNNIDTDFTDYVNLLINQDFEKSMDYIPEAFFDILPKETLIAVLKKTFNNHDMQIELKDPKILKIQDVRKIEGKYYSELTYSNIMNMKMIGEEDESEEDKELRISLTKMAFEKTFDKNNVSYDEETEFFSIYVVKDVYAISNNGETEWKFLTIEKNQKEVLKTILPKKLWNKL